MITSPVTVNAPAPPLPSAVGTAFTIAAERRLKECEEQAQRFTKPVYAYRGES